MLSGEHAGNSRNCARFAWRSPPLQPSPAANVVPIQIVNNHVVVDVTLDGAGPFHFIVDSGAGNLIDPAVAAAIGAHVRGRVRLVGVGGRTESGSLTRIHRVGIGAATFVDQRFVVAAAHATFAAAEGPPVDGLIGRAIIGSSVTVFDYARRTLTFDAGDAAVAGDGGIVLPASVVDGEPHVPCRLANVRGSCAIDTGSRLNVTVLAPSPSSFPQSFRPRSRRAASTGTASAAPPTAGSDGWRAWRSVRWS